MSDSLFLFRSGDPDEVPKVVSIHDLTTQDIPRLAQDGYVWYKKPMQTSLNPISDAYSELNPEWDQFTMIEIEDETQDNLGWVTDRTDDFWD